MLFISQGIKYSKQGWLQCCDCFPHVGVNVQIGNFIDTTTRLDLELRRSLDFSRNRLVENMDWTVNKNIALDIQYSPTS